MQFSEWNQHSLEDLKRAIEQALARGELFDKDRAKQIRQQLENMSEEQLDQLLSRMVQKLVDEGYITLSSPRAALEKPESRVEVKVTDKSIDFLGFQDAEGFARIAGARKFRRARYARHGDGCRIERIGETL